MLSCSGPGPGGRVCNGTASPADTEDPTQWRGARVREWRVDTALAQAAEARRFYGAYEGGVDCAGAVAARTGLCRGRMRVRTQSGQSADAFNAEWRGDAFFASYDYGVAATGTGALAPGANLSTLTGTEFS